MSGIAVIWNLDGAPVEKHSLTCMLAAVRHRGWDKHGEWFGPSVGLAQGLRQTRDEPSPQGLPVSACSGELYITLDGQLDNRSEVKHVLPIGSVEFNAPDAALILAAYIHWGTGCVDRLVGAFSFAIWDGRRQELFCARDHLGIRPFFYSFHNESFYAGSEIHQILDAAQITPVINDEYIADYFARGPAEPEYTAFKDVQRLMPGHWLLVSRSGPRLEEYWSPIGREVIRYREEREYVEHFQHLLEQAVRRQLHGTGTIGISLSGGLDSSSIAVVLEDLRQRGVLGNRPLVAIQMIFDELNSIDERVYTAELKERLGFTIREVPADSLWPMKGLLEGAVYTDEPNNLAHPAYWDALLQVAKDEGVQVMLGGFVGDSLWMSHRLLWADLLVRLRWNTLLRQLRRGTATGSHWGYLFWRYCLSRLLWGVQTNRRRYPDWVTPSFAKQMSLKERVRRYWPVRRFASSVDLSGAYAFNYGRLFIRDYYFNVPFAPELRYPYADRELVEFTLALPVEQKVSMGGTGRPVQTKVLLRRSMRGALPEMIRTRTDDTDFTPLFLRALKREWSGIQKLLSRPYLAEFGYVDTESCLRWATQERFGTARDSANSTKDLVQLELWIRKVCQRWASLQATGKQRG